VAGRLAGAVLGAVAGAVAGAVVAAWGASSENPAASVSMVWAAALGV